MHRIEITADEAAALAWLSNRYVYAAAIWDAGIDSEGEHEVSESDAWAIAEAVSEEDGHCPCAGPSLVEKIDRLILSIV